MELNGTSVSSDENTGYIKIKTQECRLSLHISIFFPAESDLS